MSETLTTRTNLKMDRRWISCGNQAMCSAMASIAPQALVEHARRAQGTELFAARTWLADQLAKFTGPPGMELRTLDDDEIESEVDYFAILLRVPLPNSQDPTQTFPVGRLGYSGAPVNAFRGFGESAVEALKQEVYNLSIALATHEVKEWLKYNGVHVDHPHPENR